MYVFIQMYICYASEPVEKNKSLVPWCRTVVHMINLIKLEWFLTVIFGEESGSLSGTSILIFCANEYRSPERGGGFKQHRCHSRASRSS